MAAPLRKTFDAVPQPRVVVAVGDCARDCGVFRGAYGVEGAVSDVVPVDLEIPGCPPDPAAIVRALRGLAGT
jgi:Ni,Fe-hydrogenase III small subunit